MWDAGVQRLLNLLDLDVPVVRVQELLEFWSFAQKVRYQLQLIYLLRTFFFSLKAEETTNDSTERSIFLE